MEIYPARALRALGLLLADGVLTGFQANWAQDNWTPLFEGGQLGPGTQLSGAQLSGAQLSGAQLSGAQLSGAQFA